VGSLILRGQEFRAEVAGSSLPTAFGSSSMRPESSMPPVVALMSGAACASTSSLDGAWDLIRADDAPGALRVLEAITEEYLESPDALGRGHEARYHARPARSVR
jgi:hypothetical protein